MGWVYVSGRMVTLSAGRGHMSPGKGTREDGVGGVTRRGEEVSVGERVNVDQGKVEVSSGEPNV